MSKRGKKGEERGVFIFIILIKIKIITALINMPLYNETFHFDMEKSEISVVLKELFSL